MNNARMMFSLLLIPAFLAPMPQSDSDPQGFTVWKSVVSRSAEQQIPWDQLRDYQNHTIGISYLRDDSPAELYESEAEIYIVQAGEATLVVGGAIVQPKNAQRDEVLGSSIEGGQKTSLREGDIVHIGANVPHQLKVAPGKIFIYTTIRVSSP
jgi:mannose-6-phosphate isomerase-like protein (cupin superfamily)